MAVCVEWPHEGSPNGGISYSALTGTSPVILEAYMMVYERVSRKANLGGTAGVLLQHLSQNWDKCFFIVYCMAFHHMTFYCMTFSVMMIMMIAT